MNYTYLNTILINGLNTTALKKQSGINIQDIHSNLTTALVLPINQEFENLTNNNKAEISPAFEHKEKIKSKSENTQKEKASSNKELYNISTKNSNSKVNSLINPKKQHLTSNLEPSDSNDNISSIEKNTQNVDEINKPDKIKQQNPIKKTLSQFDENKNIRKDDVIGVINKSENNQTKNRVDDVSNKDSKSEQAFSPGFVSSTNFNIRNAEQEEKPRFYNDGKIKKEFLGQEIVNQNEFPNNQIKVKTIDLNIPFIRNKTKTQSQQKNEPVIKGNTTSDEPLSSALKSTKPTQINKDHENLLVNKLKNTSIGSKGPLVTKFDTVYPYKRELLPKVKESNAKLLNDISKGLNKKQNEINTLKEKIAKLELKVDNQIFDQKRKEKKHITGPPVSTNLGGWSVKERSYFR